MFVIDSNTVFGGYVKRPLDTSLPRLVEILRRHGIGRAVTCSTTGIFYDDDPGNEETLAACAEHTHLIPAATVNPTRYFGGPEVGRLVEQGFRLLRLYNVIQGWPVRSFAPFEALCAAASEAGLAIMLDLGVAGDLTAIGELARKLQVPVIVCGCNYHHIAEAAIVGQRVPNLVVELHQLTVPDGIEVLHRALGCERLVYGSWAPFNYVTHTLLILEHAKITDADRAKIAGGNIARILGIPAEETTR